MGRALDKTAVDTYLGRVRATLEGAIQEAVAGCVAAAAADKEAAAATATDPLGSLLGRSGALLNVHTTNRIGLT